MTTATRSSTVCLCLYAPNFSQRIADPECVAFHGDEAAES